MSSGIGINLSGGGGGGTGIKAYATALLLPAPAAPGTLAYVISTKSYYFSDGLAWALILDDADHADLQLVIANLAAHIAQAVAAHAASAISNVAAGNVSSTNVQSAVNELQTHIDTTTANIATVAANLAAHIAQAIAAHAASAISNVAAGNITSTNVQSAVNELQTHIDTNTANIATNAAAIAAHIAQATAAHAASAISFSPGGTVAATNVQTAIAEVASEADTRLTSLESASHVAVTLAAFGSTPNANGLSLATQALNMQPANATNPGGISTGTQVIPGEKDFAAGVNVGSVSSLGASEQFKVVSTAKGAIPAPAMTTAQKTAITSPSTGLRVYDTDLKQPCFFNGVNWENEVGFSTPASVAIADGATFTPGVYRRQIQQVSGSGGAATASDILPTNALAGDHLVLVGTSMANSLTIINTANVVVNGSCTLGQDDILTLIFINSQWKEMSRSA